MRITHRLVRSLLILLVVLVVTVPLTLFAFGQVHAQAAADTCGGYSGYAHCKVVSETWTFKTQKLDVCLGFKLTGNIGYNFKPATSRTPPIWSHQTLLSPTLHVYVHKYAGGDCTGTSTVTRVVMAQRWTGYACSFNPTLSINVPFSLGFSAWPNCGDRNYGTDRTNYGLTTQATQYNTGNPLAFSDYTEFGTGLPCYGVYVTSTAYQDHPPTNKSDGFTSSVSKVCLPKP